MQVNDKIGKYQVNQSIADKAWQSWGYEAFFEILTLIPLEVLTDDFVKDRETIFPILKRSDYKHMRPSGVAALKSRLEFVEKVVLAKQAHFSGGKLGVADVHALWGLRWGLRDLGAEKEPGLGKDVFPKFWKLIESLPEAKPETLSSEDTIKAIKESELTAGDVSVQKDDPIGIAEGTEVTVESIEYVASIVNDDRVEHGTDKLFSSAPGSHPQAGKLLGTSVKTVTLGLADGIRLHFPREGYTVKKA